MTYQCDTCSNIFLDKSHGSFFDQNRILTSPSYWEHLIIGGTVIGKLQDEGQLEMWITMYCKNDPNGYTVCNACRDKFLNDDSKAKLYGLESYVRSIPSGQVNKQSILIVAGTIWQKYNGSWPSFIKQHYVVQQKSEKVDEVTFKKEMNKKMFCLSCNKWIEEPSVNSWGREWIDYHNGMCPICKSVLSNDQPPLRIKKKFQKDIKLPGLIVKFINILSRGNKNQIVENEIDQIEKIAFYVFNSSLINDKITASYGAYAQNTLLTALRQEVKALGGWDSLMGKGIIGCHGDLFLKDIFDNPTGLKVLSDWFKLYSKINYNFSSDFLIKLNNNPANVGYIPYAIGIWPVKEITAVNVHKILSLSNPTGYLGNFYLGPNPNLIYIKDKLDALYKEKVKGTNAIFSAMALALSLPIKMGITINGQCFGWQLTESELNNFNLELLPK